MLTEVLEHCKVCNGILGLQGGVRTRTPLGNVGLITGL